MTDPEFKPCVMYLEDADHTEMLLADTLTYWRLLFDGCVEIGYDMKTHEIVGIRVVGDVRRSRSQGEG